MILKNIYFTFQDALNMVNDFLLANPDSRIFRTDAPMCDGISAIEVCDEHYHTLALFGYRHKD